MFKAPGLPKTTKQKFVGIGTRKRVHSPWEYGGGVAVELGFATQGRAACDITMKHFLTVD